MNCVIDNSVLGKNVNKSFASFKANKGGCRLDLARLEIEDVILRCLWHMCSRKKRVCFSYEIVQIFCLSTASVVCLSGSHSATT